MPKPKNTQKRYSAEFKAKAVGDFLAFPQHGVAAVADANKVTVSSLYAWLAKAGHPQSKVNGDGLPQVKASTGNQGLPPVPRPMGEKRVRFCPYCGGNLKGIV